MGERLNIYQRINEVRKAVEKVAKDKKVEGYMAVTHDQVTALTRDHLVAQGIVIVPRLLSERTVPTGTFTSRETPFIRYEATYEFDVVNADEPKDQFSARIGVHAIDHGDKAPGKALSYAKKALVLKLLELESVSDEEGRQEQHKSKTEHKSVAKETWETMTGAQKNTLTDISTLIIDLLKEGEDQKAFEYYTEQKEKLDVEEQVALWSRLDSTQRSTIKRLGEAHKKSEVARKAIKAA
jgi:hypothetical protein